MDNVVSTFPLLRLPKNAMLNTLRTMDYPQIFGISFLSKKTKDLIVSLTLTTTIFHVEVKYCLSIMLFFPSYESVVIELCQLQGNDRLQELEKPGNFLIRGDYPQTWTTSFSVRQLLDHLKLVCHSSITSLKFSVDFERFNLESLHRNVKDIQKICLISGNHELNKRIISVLKPASLCLESRALVNGSVPRHILIQNFNVIEVPTVQITLDELLMTNARGIEMLCRQLSAKTLNRFLKMWTKGSNPRLERMVLQLPGNFLNGELFRGLKFEDVPPNAERFFKSSDGRDPERVIQGLDIWRLDGTRATISASGPFNFVKFKFYVWHDHCIVI